MFFPTIKHIVSRGSIILINQLSVLISLPILAARLDFEVFGQVAIGFLLTMLSWIVSDWGIQNYSIEVWKKFKSVKDRMVFVSSAITLNFLAALFFLIAVLVLILFQILDFPISFWLAIIPSVLMGSVYPLWFYQVEKNPQDMILPTFFSRIIFLFIIFYVVQDNDDAYWALLAQGINMTIITIYSFYRMVRVYKVRLQSVDVKKILNIECKSRPFLINALANNQINTIWSFGLSIFGGPLAMAIFNLGDQIYRAGGAITNIIAQSIRIQFIDKTFSQIGFIFYFFTTLYIVIAFVICLSAEPLIQNFFSFDYLPAIPIIKIMTIAWALHGIIKLLNYPILGQLHGAEWLNIKTYKILWLHGLAFLFWMCFLKSTLSLSVMFTIAIGCQLLIFLFHIFQKIR